MNARDLITERLENWREVNASALADETFDDLDADDLLRLARRAWTEEVRSRLREKDSDGVPRFASIEAIDDEGQPVRVYKATALFEVADFGLAIRDHLREIAAHRLAAEALVRRCNALHGTQLSLPGIESAS